MRTKGWCLAGLALLVLGWSGLPAMAAEKAPASQAAGPGLVAAGQWQVGVSGTWVFAERFQDTQENFREADQSTGSEASTNLKIRDDRFYMAQVSYGLARWLTLSAGVGLAQGGVLSETLHNGNWEAKLKPGLVWGLGARGLVWEGANGLGLTAGLSYLRYDNRGIDHWQYPEGGTTADSGVGVDGQVDYWRVEGDVRLHWNLGRWRPFVGGAYAYAELKDEDRWSYPDGTWSRYDFSTQSEDRWGLLGGVEAELMPNLNLLVQGMLFAREEVGLWLSYGF